MAFPDDPQGAVTPPGETAPDSHSAQSHDEYPHDDLPPFHGESLPEFSGHEVSGEVLTETGLPHSMALTPSPARKSYEPKAEAASPLGSILGGLLGGLGLPPKPPGGAPPDEEDAEEDGMSRMSFLEHLEELRKRLLLALAGVGVAFVICLLFSDQLWEIVFQPAGAALRALHAPETLKLISPTDAFQIMWMKVPILFAVFLSCPWVLYQVWAFISPGLYKKERRYAVPFVVSSAGLFVLGGLFAYFVAFRFGLEFLLGMGIGKGIEPGVNVNEYYDLFVDVMLGVGIVFEIPVLLFLLTLLHIASPAFLVKHSRYAIFLIVLLAAFITPTGDAFNLALFATPMIVLFYVGIFASYILVLRREKKNFPWGTFLKWSGLVLLILVALSFPVARYYGYHFVPRWPLFIK